MPEAEKKTLRLDLSDVTKGQRLASKERTAAGVARVYGEVLDLGVR